MGLSMETNNNMKDLNIAEILKYAPKGLKLYSPLFGEVEFDFLDDNNAIHISSKELIGTEYFDLNGRYFKSYSNAECLLFPSINHRCWQHWQNTLFLESIGSVCVDTITGNKFILGEDGTYFGDNTGNSYHFLIDDEDARNYLLNSRYASPEEAKEFFEELDKNGYEWDGEKVVKKGNIKPKFKVGDVIRHKDTGIFFAIAEVKDDCYYSKGKTCLLFKYQDNWELAASKANLSLEVKVSMMEDEILALKEKLLALEKLAKDSEIKIDALECGGKPFQCSDKAGDCVTLKDMKS